MNGPVAELLHEPGVFLAVTTAGKSLSHKRDVTECRSRSLVVTHGRSVPVQSFVMTLVLNLSLRRLIVLDIVISCLDILNFVHNGLQHANGTFMNSCGRLSGN